MREVKNIKYPNDDSGLNENEVEDDSWSSRRGLKSLLGMPIGKGSLMPAEVSTRKGDFT